MKIHLYNLKMCYYLNNLNKLNNNKNNFNLTLLKIINFDMLGLYKKASKFKKRLYKIKKHFLYIFNKTFKKTFGKIYI